MSNLETVLSGALALLKIMPFPAILIIVTLHFNFKRLKKSFASSVMRRGVIKEIGVSEGTKAHPHRHCFAIFSFADDNSLREVIYEGGDLKDAKVGDEIPVYFLPDGATTIVCYDDETTKKKFLQQVLVIIILCLVLCFLIPVVGIRTMDMMPK